MNTTTTRRRFAVRRLLPCLALLVPSVSGFQPPISDFGCSSSAGMTTYKSLDIDFDGMKYSSALEAAMAMAVKAEELDEAESPHTGEAYLFAAQVLAKYIGYGVELQCSGKNLDDHAEESAKAGVMLATCLARAEEHGADTTALGKIFYDMGRQTLKLANYFRSQGQEELASSTGELAVFWMQEALNRGISEEEVFRDDENE